MTDCETPPSTVFPFFSCLTSRFTLPARLQPKSCTVIGFAETLDRSICRQRGGQDILTRPLGYHPQRGDM